MFLFARAPPHVLFFLFFFIFFRISGKRWKVEPPRASVSPWVFQFFHFSIFSKKLLNIFVFSRSRPRIGRMKYLISIVHELKLPQHLIESLLNVWKHFKKNCANSLKTKIGFVWFFGPFPSFSRSGTVRACPDAQKFNFHHKIKFWKIRFFANPVFR